VHQHGSSLHLFYGVESAHAYVCTRERGLAGSDFGQHLVGVGASEHRKLPHWPVPVGVVSAGGAGHNPVRTMAQGQGVLGHGELDARAPAHVSNQLQCIDNLHQHKIRRQHTESGPPSLLSRSRLCFLTSGQVVVFSDSTRLNRYTIFISLRTTIVDTERYEYHHVGWSSWEMWWACSKQRRATLVTSSDLSRYACISQSSDYKVLNT